MEVLVIRAVFEIKVLFCASGRFSMHSPDIAIIIHYKNVRTPGEEH